MSFAATTPAMATAIVRGLPVQYRDALSGVADDVVRHRPDAATWSMVEYLCHVRDVYVVFADRIRLALAEDHPTFEPLGNDRRAEERRYYRAGVDTTLDDLDSAVERFLELVDTLDGDDWGRMTSRLPGEDRDVLWLVRQAAHEGRHHLGDIERVGAALHRR